jgi:MarR family transcriptional regulator, organic hydroperoxide resistance regulator
VTRAKPRLRTAATPRDDADEANAATREILRHWQEAVPHDRLAHLVRDAARAFQRSLQLRLAAHGVSFGHWTFLRVLWEQDGITQKALSQRAGVMEPSTFAAVTAMEKRGYVTRRHRPGNRKNVYVHLTRAGRALQRTLVPLAEDVNRAGVDGLAPQRVDATRSVLLAIIANLADDEVRAQCTATAAKPAAARRRPIA